jgi:hypothetical protein
LRELFGLQISIKLKIASAFRVGRGLLCGLPCYRLHFETTFDVVISSEMISRLSEKEWSREIFVALNIEIPRSCPEGARFSAGIRPEGTRNSARNDNAIGILKLV